MFRSRIFLNSSTTRGLFASTKIFLSGVSSDSTTGASAPSAGGDSTFSDLEASIKQHKESSNSNNNNNNGGGNHHNHHRNRNERRKFNKNKHNNGDKNATNNEGGNNTNNGNQSQQQPQQQQQQQQQHNRNFGGFPKEQKHQQNNNNNNNNRDRDAYRRERDNNHQNHRQHNNNNNNNNNNNQNRRFQDDKKFDTSSSKNVSSFTNNNLTRENPPQKFPENKSTAKLPQQSESNNKPALSTTASNNNNNNNNNAVETSAIQQPVQQDVRQLELRLRQAHARLDRVLERIKGSKNVPLASLADSGLAAVPPPHFGASREIFLSSQENRFIEQFFEAGEEEAVMGEVRKETQEGNGEVSSSSSSSSSSSYDFDATAPSSSKSKQIALGGKEKDISFSRSEFGIARAELIGVVSEPVKVMQDTLLNKNFVKIVLKVVNNNNNNNNNLNEDDNNVLYFEVRCYGDALLRACVDGGIQDPNVAHTILHVSGKMMNSSAGELIIAATEEYGTLSVIVADPK